VAAGFYGRAMPHLEDTCARWQEVLEQAQQQQQQQQQR
jgi:hypothetical protein